MKVNYSKSLHNKSRCLNTMKSFLTFKVINTWVFLYFQKVLTMKRSQNTQFTTAILFCLILTAQRGEYNVIVRDSEPIRLLESLRSLSVYILNIHVYIPEFLKTGLAKISTHSTTWQFKTIKFIQRKIKGLHLTPGSKEFQRAQI